MIYLTAALLGALVPGKISKTMPSEDGAVTSVLLAAGPIHYDFLLPLTDETHSVFADLTAYDLPIDNLNAEWLVIGWGAREFYTTAGQYSDVKASAVWSGITGDASVLRVDVIGSLNPALDFPELKLTGSQYTHFLSAISDTFERDQNGSFILVSGAGFGSTDRFFEARGDFDILRTCNTWISRMIRQAGVKFGMWTPTPYAVTLSLKWFGDI